MKPKHKHPVLTIRAKGPATTGGRIALSDLVALCQNVQLALERVARVLHGETDSRRVGRKPGEIARSCPLEVVAMNRGSFEVGFDLPADTFEAMHPGYEALEKLVDGVAVINSGEEEFPAEYDEGVKECLSEIGGLLGKGIKSIELVAKIGKKKRHRALISRKTADRLKAHSAATETKGGAVEGRLLMVDFGRPLEVCRIHPQVGDPVTCHFGNALEETIQSLLKRFVRAHGQVTLDVKTGQPRSIRVTDIEPLVIQGDQPIPAEAFWEEKSLERLAAEQKVSAVSKPADVFGGGEDLWADDAEFEAFLTGLRGEQA